jgi:hypothetical protein
MGLAARPIRRGWVGRLGERQHRHYGCPISLLGCHGKFRQSGLEHEGAVAGPGVLPPVRRCSVWHVLDDGHSGAHHEHPLVVAAAVSRKQQESVISGER